MEHDLHCSVFKPKHNTFLLQTRTKKWINWFLIILTIIKSFTLKSVYLISIISYPAD